MTAPSDLACAQRHVLRLAVALSVVACSKRTAAPVISDPETRRPAVHDLLGERPDARITEQEARDLFYGTPDPAYEFAEKACANLRELHCGEGWPTMRLELQSGCPDEVHAWPKLEACLMAAKTVKAVRACGLKCGSIP